MSELAPQPVAFYAAVFFLVNATYIALDLGAYRSDARREDPAEGAQDHARALADDVVPVRGRLRSWR
mgnify:CR=1 FL=1